MQTHILSTNSCYSFPLFNYYLNHPKSHRVLSKPICSLREDKSRTSFRANLPSISLSLFGSGFILMLIFKYIKMVLSISDRFIQTYGSHLCLDCFTVLSVCCNFSWMKELLLSLNQFHKEAWREQHFHQEFFTCGIIPRPTLKSWVRG